MAARASGTGKKTAKKKQAKNKPARDSKGRLLPGSTGNPNGRPVGRVGLSTRLREVLCYRAQEDGPTVAEAAMRKLAQAILDDPAGHWPILKWYAEREEGATPFVIGMYAEPGAQSDPKDAEVIEGQASFQGELDKYLASLEDEERTAVVAVLAKVEGAVPGILRCQ